MASPTPFEKKVVWGASFGPDVRLPLNTDNGNLVLSLKMDNGFQQTHFNDPGLAYEIFGRDDFRYFRTDPKEHYVLLYVYSADTKKEFDFAYVTHSSPMLVCWPWVGCQITKLKDWIFKEKSYFFEEETRFWRGTWPNLDLIARCEGEATLAYYRPETLTITKAGLDHGFLYYCVVWAFLFQSDLPIGLARVGR